MSTVPVNVWTAQLSSPLLPCVPLLVQSCKALLSLLCSLPKTNAVRVGVATAQRVARRQEKYGDPLGAQESRVMGTGKEWRKRERERAIDVQRRGLYSSAAEEV
jgi:hypothetical protein